MSRGLDWQTVEFSFSKGLNQKADPRLVQAPELVRAVDCEFDDTGGLRLRKPYTALATDMISGGMISGCRRMYPNGNELMIMTNDALLSWSPQRVAWASKGTHLAVKTSETPRFITTGEQTQCDRAELDNCVVHVWYEVATSGTTDGIYYAITDKTTGAVTVATTELESVLDSSRPRVVATTTKILLFYNLATTGLVVRAITPSTGAITSATTVLAAASFGDYYDVVKTTGADSVTFAARRAVTTSYEVGLVTSALGVTQVTKARTCDGAIAVSSDADAKPQIIRGNTTNVQGDYLTAALVDVTTAQAIGTISSGTVVRIAACHRSDTRCYVFWEDPVATGPSDRNVKFNYVNTAGAIGTQAVLVRRVHLASRAFTYGASVFVNLQFHGTSTFVSSSSLFDGIAAQLQNTYYLYRDDGFLTAKSVTGRAGGAIDVSGFLPGVALTSGSTAFSWCGVERRVISIGTVLGGLGYGDRGPRDVTYTFDSNEARRCARLGDTLYIACGEGVLAYDGSQICEVGFHVAPWHVGVVTNAAGSIVAGTYAFRYSYRWDNARGERERSTTAMSGSAPLVATDSFDHQDLIPLFVTHKTNRPVAMEVWRTAIAPTDEAPFYLVTSQDPATVAGSNRYIVNDTTINDFTDFNDDMTDALLTVKESNPENGAVLESLPAPPCTHIVASADRLFIAGIAGDAHTVRYSKLRAPGEVAAFHDALSVAIPEAGADITGLAFLHETLIVFRETAIYALIGFGYDNTGGGQNYEARLISSDCGAVNQESIVLTPLGLIFKSSRGWYRLAAAQPGALAYVGAGVCDYDSESVYSAHVVEAQHQVRIVTSGRVLMFDWIAESWAEWSITGGLHACMWSGTYHVLKTSSVVGEVSSYATADYGLDVEMLIHLSGLQGFSRCRKILALGEYRSTHTLRLRLGDYTEGTYNDDKTWTPSPTTVGGVLQVQHGPSRQQQEVIRARLTSSTTAGEKLKLSALSLELGFKPGTFRHLPAAQRQ